MAAKLALPSALAASLLVANPALAQHAEDSILDPQTYARFAPRVVDLHAALLPDAGDLLTRERAGDARPQFRRGDRPFDFAQAPTLLNGGLRSENLQRACALGQDRACGVLDQFVRQYQFFVSPAPFDHRFLFFNRGPGVLVGTVGRLGPGVRFHAWSRRD